MSAHNTQPHLPKETDLYALVHKGIRYAHTHLLPRIGAADWFDDCSSAELLRDIREHLEMCADHLEHENAAIHTALETRCPGASGQVGAHHEEHERSFRELASLLALVERARGTDRALKGNRLYHRFALFVADDFRHMEEEESVVMPLLENLFSTDELLAIKDQIIGAIEPVMMIRFMKAILSALTPDEREAMLAGMKAEMPVEAFQGLMGALTKAGWSPSQTLQ